MALNLPEGMKEYYGKNTEQMPTLLKAGEVPISGAILMRERLENGDGFPDLWNNWFDTSDLVAYPRRSDYLYCLLTVNNQGQITENGRKALELIRSDNLASNHGALIERLKDLGRKGLIKVARKGITTGKYLTKEQVLEEQLWRILARHPDEVPAEFAEDPNLLKEYSGKVESKTNSHNNIALYVGDSLKDKITLKAWCIDWLSSGSIVDGRYYLDNDYGRFAVLAPEALRALSGDAKGDVKKYTEEEAQRYTRAVERLKEFFGSKSDLVRDISILENKL